MSFKINTISFAVQDFSQWLCNIAGNLLCLYRIFLASVPALAWEALQKVYSFGPFGHHIYVLSQLGPPLKGRSAPPDTQPWITNVLVQKW